ncbi:MAG: sigma 54-interacting transcriptional regulator [Azonexus sp.]
MKISVYVFDDDCSSASEYFDSLTELMPDEVLAIKQSGPQLNRRFYELINLGGDSDQIDVTFSLSANEAEIKKEIAEIGDFGDLILIDDNYEEIDSMFGQRVILPTLIESIRTPLRLLPVCCLWTLHWRNDINRRRTFASFLGKSKVGDRVIMGLGKDDPNGLLQAIRWTANLKRLALMEADLAAAARVAGIDSNQVTPQYSGLIGESSGMLEVRRRIAKFAPKEAPVIILGERGTGKNIVAEAIHRASHRKNKEFVTFNAGAIANRELTAAQLFGHQKGAHTGADKKQKGMLEAVGDGTLFIDEIGTLSREIQTQLLRVLQEKEFTLMGLPLEVKKFQGHIVTATNADLKQMCADGTFRDDLYDRLYVLDIYLPTLAERGRADIELLVKHFLSQHMTRTGSAIAIESAAMEKLCRYNWPGNVRELKNKIEKAIALADNATRLTLADFPDLCADDQQRAANVPYSGGTVADIQDSLTACKHYPEMLANLLSVARYVTEGGDIKNATKEEVGLFVADDKARGAGKQPKQSEARGKALGQHIRTYPEDYAKLLLSKAGNPSDDVISFFLRWPEVCQAYERVR